MTPSVVVVGAGPAGLMAAIETARAGAETVLLEVRAAPGGRLLYQVQPIAIGAGDDAERPDWVCQRLVDDAVAAGVDLRTGALAAGSFADTTLLIMSDGLASGMAPDALIVTTGATDLPYPFMGATLPGVISGSGLRIVMNQYRVLPGKRFAIIGGGDDAEELASDVMLAGGEVVWSGIAPAAFLRAEGVRGVHVLMVGQERYAVDVIGIAAGRQADPALATMAGAALGFSVELGGIVPLLDDRMQSSPPGIYVAGDAAGSGSVADVLAEGRLAGIAAANALGLAGDDEVLAARASGGVQLARRIATRGSLQPLAVQPYA